MKKLAIISVFMFLFTNVLSMENPVQSKKVTRKRKDKQLEELISLQKTTNQLLLLQIEQNRVLFQTASMNYEMKQLYQKHPITLQFPK